MCYAKPGPRCSTESVHNLMTAARRYKRTPSKINEEVLAKAREKFLNTPKGIEALRTGEFEEGGKTVPASVFGIQQDPEEAERRAAEREKALAEHAEAEGSVRKLGRPALPDSEVLSQRLETPFSPREKQELKELADASGLSVAEFVRARLQEDEDTSGYEARANRIIRIIDGEEGKGRKDKWGNRPNATKELRSRGLIDSVPSRNPGRKPSDGEDNKRVVIKVDDQGNARKAATARVRVNVTKQTEEEVAKRADALGISKSDYIRRKALYGNAFRLEAHQGSAKMRRHAEYAKNVALHGWDWLERHPELAA